MPAALERVATGDLAAAQDNGGDLPQVEAFADARTLITTRRNISAKRLVAPGPTPAQLDELLRLAAAAPDHGQLTPWRFIVIPVARRHLLAEAFALALLDRDPAATPDQASDARLKAYRSPLLLVAVACLQPREPDIPALERMVSMGAAIQNLLLGAHAMGFGAGLTSGRAMTSPRLARVLGLAPGEVAVCCVNIGTAGRRSSATGQRPAPASFTTVL